MKTFIRSLGALLLLLDVATVHADCGPSTRTLTGASATRLTRALHYGLTIPHDQATIRTWDLARVECTTGPGLVDGIERPSCLVPGRLSLAEAFVVIEALRDLHVVENPMGHQGTRLEAQDLHCQIDISHEPLAHQCRLIARWTDEVCATPQ